MLDIADYIAISGKQTRVFPIGKAQTVPAPGCEPENHPVSEFSTLRYPLKL